MSIISDRLSNNLPIPQDLKYIKQVKKDGKQYLLIEIEETAMLA